MIRILLAMLVGSAAPPSEPVTRVAGRVMDRIERIRSTMKETEYRHATRVRRKDGYYGWDCSGMANWILRRDAPKAFAAIGRERPVAWSYWRVIRKAPTERPRRGWQQIADIQDVRPGDVFAWRRPAHWPKGGSTGHVGFVMEPPAAVEKSGRFADVDAFTVRVVDATSLPHQDDTRAPEGNGGFGFGTLLFVTDKTGRAHAYGWFGTRSRGVIPTEIAFGRIHR